VQVCLSTAAKLLQALKTAGSALSSDVQNVAEQVQGKKVSFHIMK